MEIFLKMHMLQWLFWGFLNNFQPNFILNFLTVILSASPNVMHFNCSNIFHYACLCYGVRLIAIEEARNYGKILYMKNIFENGWWEEAYTSSYSLDLALAISYKNYQKNLAYFSHLAPLILLIFTKRQSQEDRTGGRWYNAPLFRS